MQDRYLFRGKRLDNGEWIIGYLWVNRTVARETYYITDDYGDIQSVDPATIGQCTGLEDENGKLVFEGDIIKSITDEDEPELYIVSFKNFRWELTNHIYGYQELNDFVNDYTTLEVIGKIHDTPELLEEQTKLVSVYISPCNVNCEFVKKCLDF